MKLYVHIPFCGSKCAYCDFYSSPKKEWMEVFVDAALNEWRQRSHVLTEPVDTLYFGGGTPSSLLPDLLKRLVDGLDIRSELREATIEANPEDVSRQWVRFIVDETAFRRVSMGVQSFSDPELSAIGRRHDSHRAIDAFRILREEGIANISCDLIYGLPGQNLKSWEKSLSTLIDLRPEHISAYLLSYEPGTRLYARLQQGKITEADDSMVEDMYSLLCERSATAGYRHYEISNFAKPGREAIHNSSYWDGSPYIGIGPGAHSWDGAKRSFNPSNLKEYIARRGLDFAETEEEDDNNRFNDMLITRLRTSRGIRLSEIAEKFGRRVADDFKTQCGRLTAEGFMSVDGGDCYTIPESHWLTSNSILLQLIRV